MGVVFIHCTVFCVVSTLNTAYLCCFDPHHRVYVVFLQAPYMCRFNRSVMYITVISIHSTVYVSRFYPQYRRCVSFLFICNTILVRRFFLSWAQYTCLVSLRRLLVQWADVFVWPTRRHTVPFVTISNVRLAGSLHSVLYVIVQSVARHCRGSEWQELEQVSSSEQVFCVTQYFLC